MVVIAGLMRLSLRPIEQRKYAEQILQLMKMPLSRWVIMQALPLSSTQESAIKRINVAGQLGEDGKDC